MPSHHLPPIAAIPNLSTIERVAVLDTLFEPCAALHTLSLDLLHTTTFDGYEALIAAVGRQLTELLGSVSASDKDWLDKILAAHPRLGEKKVDSELSRKEQAQLQSGTDEADRLRTLNEEYEEKFPGLKYVVFVNGRDRSTILSDIQLRIARGDIGLERAEAIKAMCDIARDRSTKLQIP